jgi:hypothetical protein
MLRISRSPTSFTTRMQHVCYATTRRPLCFGRLDFGAAPTAGEHADHADPPRLFTWRHQAAGQPRPGTIPQPNPPVLADHLKVTSP